MSILESNWKKFVIFGEENVDVRKPIVDSWIRSKKAGVSYENNRILPLIEKDEWKDRIRKNRMLIQSAHPVMQDIFHLVKGSGYRISLVDPDGYFLEVLADQKAEAESIQIGAAAGVKWKEEYVGTTGLTIALNTRMPIVTTRAEHFWTKLWVWDCAAAPIFVGDRFAGVLNFCRLSREDGLNEYLSLAVSGARSIGLRLQMETMRMKERTLSDVMSFAQPASNSTGILAFDGEGRLVFNNHSASEFLNALQKEKNLQETTRLDHLFLYDAKSAPGEPASYLECEADGNEYVIESKKCGSEDEVSSTILFIHLKPKKKSNLISYGPSPILSAFPTKEESFRKTLHRSVKAARSDMCILLQGESGTGKDYMARAIHQESERRKRPFIAVNCASLPKELISSELFGYAPGAFTGASRNGSPGKMEAANGGTLFLDEIGDMPLDLQAVLLRALEEKQVTRLGSAVPVPVDVRFIAASCKDLQELVRRKEFREDLYYRISIATLRLPALRDRESDIEDLFRDIASQICKKAGRPPLALTADALKLLQRQPWKGNLRELRNAIERMAHFHEEDIVDAKHLAEYIDLRSGNERFVGQDEKGILIAALERSSGNRAMAARELGISRTALYRKLEKYGIEASL